MPSPEPIAPALSPGPPKAIHASDEDWERCREWTAHHSKSFYFSSLLLPSRARADAWALYAFCRRADDAVDEDATPEEGPDDARVKLARVAGLRGRLDKIYGGEALPDDPIDRAFGEMAWRRAMPREAPEVLLKGMEMDALEVSYDTWDDLLTYCFRVASIVGLMMVKILGHNASKELEPYVLLRATDLGVGMQLTNICRDVGEDARRGRVYLPEALLKRHGTSQGEILSLVAANQPAPASVKAAVKEVLARAEAHYLAADRGIPALPFACRLSIASARRIYAAIGDKVAEQDYDSLNQRAYVSLGGKLWLLLSALIPRRVKPLQAPGPEDPTLWALIQDAGLISPGLTPPRG